MRKKFFMGLMTLLVCCAFVRAQEAAKNDLQQRAEAALEKGENTTARYLYIRAYEDYVGKGQTKKGVECGVKATGLYYSKENLYKEAFDLLRRIEQSIEAKSQGSEKAALRYLTTKERYQMYMKMSKSSSASDQLKNMEQYANASGDENLKNDLLYTKTVYYYTFGQTDKGNATFKEMAGKLMASKEYGKVEDAYQTLIANGRKSNNATLVAQSYKSYLAWKDSANALVLADTVGVLKQQIADNEASIAEKDSSLTARQAVIVGLSILAAILAAALVLGAIVLMRYIFLTRKQKKTIQMLNENNALKAKFISNISAQLAPTLQKLDSRTPEVKALLDFSDHIQTLSELENQSDATVEKEDTQMSSFCEGIVDQIRDKVASGVVLTVNAPKLSAKIHREYVSHILLHLLSNAAIYTPAGGHITLEYKKRGAHKHQFLVSDTGCGIPEEKREDVFKPFLEIHDLTTGDGLGLPICKQMALKMNGDLDIDSAFTKGTRFVLNLQD
ncbi:MAG: sensor histidine kinase [Bacteroidaceae bacterium]|nr:sensor histidine kinase [Bacteroidaceae bacterium]